MGSRSGVDGTLDVTLVSPAGAAYTAGGGTTAYLSPDGRSVGVVTNGAILFSDDFGGAAVDTTARWDVIDGGLGANPTLRGRTLVQGAIGSGVTGVTDSVSGSALSVVMGTTLGAERWYLSQQAFAGTEDLLVILSKSQALTANMIWIGLVEVDPVTLIPLLNPNLAGYFTNMGGVEFGQTATAAAFACNAVGDSSGAIATGSTATAIAALSTLSEFNIEFHAEDVIASNGTVDSSAAKGATPSRVSTQVPNDGRVYKLLMRFKNVGAPGSATTVTVARILVWDSQEMRVEVASGRGDSNGQKAVAVNVTNGSGAAVPITLGASTTLTLGGVYARGITSGGLSSARIVSGFDGVAKASAGQLYSYDLYNTQASARFFQIYASATAVAAGGAPVMTIPLPPSSRVALSTDIGWAVATGLAWGVTTDAAGSSQGAGGDVVGVLGYA